MPILSRVFAPSKRFITSIKSLGEGVFRRLEGTFGHVIPEADVVFVHFSSAGFRGRAAGQMRGFPYPPRQASVDSNECQIHSNQPASGLPERAVSQTNEQKPFHGGLLDVDTSQSSVILAQSKAIVNL